MIANRHIIVEGENGCGKSSLIKLINEKYSNFVNHHFAFPKGITKSQKYGFQRGQFDLMFSLMNEIQKQNIFFCFDRAHIGEYVWSPIYRDQFPHYLQDLEVKWKKLPILLIYVYCDPNKIVERFKTEREDERCPNIEELATNQNSFKYFIKESPFPSIEIDTTNTKTPNITRLMEIMNEQ